MLHLEEDILQLLSQRALLQRGACRLVERASELRVAQFVGLASLVCDEAQVLGFYREGLQLSLENSNLVFEPVDLVLRLLLQRLILLAVVVLVLLALLVELFIFGPLVRQLLLQLALLQFQLLVARLQNHELGVDFLQLGAMVRRCPFLHDLLALFHQLLPWLRKEHT